MNNAPFVIDSVFISLSLIKGAYQSPVWDRFLRSLRQHRAIRQEVSDRIFATIQSLENEGILYVFLVFQTEEVGQKDGGDSQTQLCGVALREVYSALLLWEFLAGCFAVSEREKVKCMVSS